MSFSSSTRRYSYLPCFPPSSSSKDQPSQTYSLLLANRPYHQLSLLEREQRQSSLLSTTAPPLERTFADGMFAKYFSSLMQRLKVNVHIIDFNLLRLQSFIFNVYPILFHPQQPEEYPQELDYEEMAIALEYYLQMDIDLFYMETCIFRGALPLLLDEGLFCQDSILSELGYRFQFCQQNHCQLCQSIHVTLVSTSPVHQFNNGYQSILNCPANCQTTNIIYVFTCPCGQYEFIGSTKESFIDMILYYRLQLNRWIHEYLTGCPSILLFPPLSMTFSSLTDQHLYEHTIQCPALLELFLHWNPSYACFIPMLLPDELQDRTAAAASSLLFLSPDEEEEIDHYIQQIPQRSAATHRVPFTMDQQQQQRQFFQQRLWTQQFSPRSSDLYSISLITVLPEHASSHLRTIIQALFILYTEPKLNPF